MLAALILIAGLTRAEPPLASGPVAETAPRALGWCIALLEGSRTLRVEPRDLGERGLDAKVAALADLAETADTPETPARVLVRVVRGWFVDDPVRLNLPCLDHLAVPPELDARISAAHRRLDQTRRDLHTQPTHSIPVSDVIEGEVAIRAYLAQLRAGARDVQRELEDAVPARAPRRRGHARKLATSTTLAALYGGATSAWALFVFNVGMHHHVALATGLTAGYGFLFGPTVVAHFNRLYLNLRGGYEALTGRRRPVTARDFATEVLATADDVEAALDDPAGERFIYQVTDVLLPLRQWDFYDPLGRAARPAPTAAELRRAVATNGWTAPPDARRLEASLIYFRVRGGPPTLISIVREARYLQDL